MANSFVYPKTWQVLSPAGGFPSPLSIVNSWRRIRQIAKSTKEAEPQVLYRELRDALCEQFAAEKLFLTGSGKEALGLILAALAKVTAKRTIALGAYTCPDLATVIIQAGFNVLPVDVSPFTLEMDISTIAETQRECVAGVVISNLYGLPETLEIFKWEKWLLIDDGCQSLLTEFESGHAGCRPATVGIASFGRGKAICGVGGGAVIVGEHSFRKALPSSVIERIQESYSFKESGSYSREFVELSKAFIYWLFSRPNLYSCLARLPFLGLGETVAYQSYQTKAFSKAQALSVLGWLDESEKIISAIKENCKLWTDLLKDTSLIQPYVEKGLVGNNQIVPIRYPVLFPDKEKRNAAFKTMARKGLGVSVSYPKAITGYLEFRNSGMIQAQCPNADSVAERILTLPVHPYVSKQSIYKAYRILKEYI